MSLKKEVFIKNPARALRAQMGQEPYVPEWQRLLSEGKLPGVPVQADLAEQQAQQRMQAIKDLQMAPKVMVPTVGQKDLAWNQRASYYDEPLSSTPVYDDNLVRNDLSSEELESIYDKNSKEELNRNHVASFKQQEPIVSSSEEYIPPTSLDQLNDNEIILIVEGQVVFSSLDESEIKNKLSDLIFEKNYSPNQILVIKRLPISISINIS